VKFVDRLENAVSILPNRPELVKEAIAKMKDKQYKISQINRDIVQKEFIREKQSEKLVDIVERLI
jgi:hypothetical protein